MTNKTASTVYFMLITALLITGCQTSETPLQKISETKFGLSEYTVKQLQAKYSSGEITVSEVVEAYLNHIEAIDKNGPELNSIIQLNPDALAIAAEMDKALQEEKMEGPLFGIPVILKDNIDTYDNMNTTAGSRALQNSKPLQDSYVAKKLREAGAIILGKANLSEWANFRGELSTSGWSGIGGQTKNPYVLDRNPCGSSSGSGVAVSANLCMLAIGTETNGSVVCPSHANGIVGIKPTVGLVSRSGIIPISFTQDTPGPMARTVTDAAICLGALTGVDSSDTKTLPSKGKALKDYTPYLNEDGLQGKRIGIYTTRLGKHPKVDILFKEAVEKMKEQGAELVEIGEIIINEVHSASFEVMLYEYKDGLNKYFASLGPDAPLKSVDELIEFNKKDSIELNHFDQQYLEMAAEKGDLNSKEYLEALEKAQRGSQANGIDKVMKENNLDAIIAPTGSPAWKTDLINGDNFLFASSSAAAIAGYPNITVPMGFVEDLPVGISIFGKAWSEPVLIEIAYAYEQATKHRRMPRFLEE